MKNWYKRASNLFFCIAFLICLTASAFGQNMFRKVNDFDGDRKADFAVTRDINGLRYWYIWQSTNGFRLVQYGSSTDQNIAGDYDGDGKVEPAIFRKTLTSPTTMDYSFWAYLNASFSWVYTVRGGVAYPESFAVVEDYDGDGITDCSRTIENNTRRITRYSQPTSGGPLYQIQGKPIRVGDLDGNDKAEIADFNENTGTGRRTDLGTTGFRSFQFGTAGDQYVAADFDGDGDGDLVVFRESDGTWWWIRSSDNVVNVAQFGQTGDVPVPADYDGDGKTDLAIWRPGETQSYYWVYGSLGNISVVPFGIGTDKVVTY